MPKTLLCLPLILLCGCAATTTNPTMRATSASKSEVVPESAPAPKKHLSPIVEIQTTLGNIDVALNDKSASKTVENFLSYVKQGHYNGTVFHRVIKNFMIQGGGFTNKFDRKSTKSPIKNEAANGLSNKRGTIAMARLPLVDSATDQFFINHRDNLFLDHKDNTKRNFGYCVFGKVVKGMDVVDRIANAKTMSKFGFRNLPITPIYIKKIVRKR